jgi:hypothetical protein
VLSALVLEGRVVTVDFLLTQREVAKQILSNPLHRGHYLMPVKGNHRLLHKKIACHPESPDLYQAEFGRARETCLHRGRIEVRRLTPSDPECCLARALHDLCRCPAGVSH